MIIIQSISNSKDVFFSQFYEVYTNSFPAEERRTYDELIKTIAYKKNFQANVLIEDKKFVGIFNYWSFDNFCYIEHFAIENKLRGQHKGSTILKEFEQGISLPIVLEVEIPDNKNAIRRIKFYESLGFKISTHRYAQPPYDGISKTLTMLIMSNNFAFADSHHAIIKATLYKQVYHFPAKENDTLII